MDVSRINLQFFASEKTEPATPRRREEARKKGQVAKSVEVSTALIVLAAFLGLNLLGPYLTSQLKDTVHYFLANMAAWQGDAAGFKALFLVALVRLAPHCWTHHAHVLTSRIPQPDCTGRLYDFRRRVKTQPGPDQSSGRVQAHFLQTGPL